MGTECWGRIRAELLKDVGQDSYKSWIEPLKFIAVEGQVAKFTAPTSFIGNWVSRSYGDKIQKLFIAEGEMVERLEFTTAKPSKAVVAKPTAAKSNPTTSGAGMGSVALDARYKFDNFVVGKPNELAHAAARRVAEGLAVNFNPLFLYGGVGLGKTHLMHAIAWEITKREPEKKVLYLSAEQFMYRFVQALRFKDTISFKELFRSVDVLMVDDVQFIAGKESTQAEFFHTFNALIEQNKQIIISADSAPGEIDGLEERIKSRLQWGLVADIHPTDYELRLGILQSKADEQARLNPGVELEPGVLEFVAHRISGNVRKLEGALTRIYAFGSLLSQPMTLEAAQECLSDILRTSEKKVTVEEIIRKVMDHYNLRMNDMLGPRRARSVARPRQIAMYLAKKLTTKSLPEIGRSFGGRDHTTVIHAVKRVEELQSDDPQVAEDVELLRRMLEA